MAANVDSMFYYGERPWHGLGTELDHPATAREAIVAAGLDWEVEQAPLYADVGGEMVGLPGRVANVRNDTKAILGVVRGRYRIVQNYEAFGFMDAVATTSGLEYHTAGALGVGEQVWLLAKLPGVIRVPGTDDVTEKFLALHTGHDGNTLLRCWWTPVRIVCQNTLTMALSNVGSGVSVKHTGGILDRIQEAQRVLGLAVAAFDDLDAVVQRLAGIQVTAEQVRAYYEQLVPDNLQAKHKTRTENVRAAMTAAFERADDIPQIRGTAWAAYNAAVEVFDHSRGASKTAPPTEDERSKRLESIWFGRQAGRKERALDVAQTVFAN